MSANSMIEDLQRTLGPDMIQQMSKQLGTDPAATSNAISLALPVLLGSLSRNASTPQGAADLDNALNAHDGSILDNFGDVLGGGAGGGGGIGGAILGHILGKRRSPVEEGVGRATGLSGGQVAQLLMMLAPLVMGVLGRMKQQKGLGPERLPDVLDQSRVEMERRTPGTEGLGRALDANGDGQIADDLARLGTSVLGGLFGAKKAS